jgi:hypothetical protein
MPFELSGIMQSTAQGNHFISLLISDFPVFHLFDYYNKNNGHSALTLDKMD